MTHRDHELDEVLDRTLEGIRRESPSSEFASAATDRVWRSLETAGHIRSCEDFQKLIPDYLAGRLPRARQILTQDHVSECLTCRRLLKPSRTVPEIPPAARPSGGTSWMSKAGWRMAAAAAVFVTVVGVSLETDVFSFESGGLIRIESVDGDLFKVSPGGAEPLAAGDEITLTGDEAILTAKGSTAMLAMADESRVEMRERSQLAVKEQKFLLPGRRPNSIVDLERGSVIIEASDQGSGHLYVDTDECRVAVSGTVFSVTHGMKGSRVSVIEGEVKVDYRGNRDVLQPGQQTTTSVALRRVPVAQEIAWSHNKEQHLALLEEMHALGQEIDDVLRPERRYSADLLDRVPVGTVVYVALPNISDELSEAYEILQSRVATSEVLAQWWNEQVRQMGDEGHLEAILDAIRDLGDQLGDEIVMIVRSTPDGETQGPLFLARSQTPEAFMQAFADEIGALGLHGDDALDVEMLEGPLPAMRVGIDDDPAADLFVWAEGGVVALTPSFDLLRAAEAALRGDSGMTIVGGEFHARLSELYDEGVEWAVGVDLQSLVKLDRHENLDKLGLSDVQHVIAERKQFDDRTENRAVLTFAGPRRKLAAWLAEPGPMGALDYVTPDANLAAGFVMKDLGVLIDELFEFIGEDDEGFEEALTQFEDAHGIDIRRDITDPLGGEFVLALDGPVLPMPSWKLIVEVYDPAKLVASLRMLVDHVNEQVEQSGGEPVLAFATETIGRREYHRIESLATGLAAHFVFDGGYLVAGPTTALIDRALQNREMGIKLTDSPAFLSMLPQDSQVDFSGVFYQNVGSLVDALSTAVGGSLDLNDADRLALQTMASATKPMVALLYGEKDRIVFSSSSEGGLLGSGLSSLTGFGSLLSMQELVAGTATQIGRTVDVRHDVHVK